jgi:hypothetical protein
MIPTPSAIKWRWWLLGIGLLLAACGGTKEDSPVKVETEPPTLAPIQTTDTSMRITVGETVQGNLQAEQDTQRWFLVGNPDDAVRVQVTRFTETLQLNVQVYAPDNTLLSEFGIEADNFAVSNPIPINSPEPYLIEISGGGTSGQYAMKILDVLNVLDSELAANTTPIGNPTVTQSPTSSQTLTPAPSATPSQTFTPTLNSLAGGITPEIAQEVSATSPASGGIEIVDSAINPPTQIPSPTLGVNIVTTPIIIPSNTPEAPALPFTESDVTPPPDMVAETPTPTAELSTAGGRLEVSVTLVNEITQAGETHRYTFFGNAGDPITLVVNPDPTNPGTLNPLIRVQAPSGEILAENDDMLPGIPDAAIRSEKLPATGVYIVYVKSADDLGTGSYWITLGDQPYTLRDVERGEAVQGAPNLENLSTYGSREVWTIDLQAGDVIEVSVEAVDPASGLDVMTEVLSPDGESLAFDNNSGEGLNAYLGEVTAPIAGTYTIHVAALDNASVGDYRLSWQIVNTLPTATVTLPASPTPATPPTLTPFPTPIPPNDTIEGVVEANSSFFYVIQADALQTINIVVLGHNSFDPILRVYDSTGTLVLEVDDMANGSTDPRARFTAEPSGLFLIEIVGFEGTGGTFTLSYLVQ